MGRASRRLRRLLIYGLVAAGVAAMRPLRPERAQPIAGAGLGRVLADAPLVDARTGRPGSLAALGRDREASVIVFLGTDCPLADLAMPRIEALHREYGPRGVVVVGAYPHAHESAADADAHARRFGASFAIVKDEPGGLADRALAERTCEAVVLDRDGVVRYRGALDDQNPDGVRRDAPTRRYAAEALDAILAGRAVALTRTEALGCLIHRDEPSARIGRGPKVRPSPPELLAAREAIGGPSPSADALGPVDYAEHVAPIVRSRCLGCHRPGGAGPFALETFEQARDHAEMIAEVVAQRRMPPWHADPRHGRFANDRSLTAREVATIAAWAARGAPAGDVDALPPPPPRPPDGWTIGRPDVVLAPPEPYAVPAEGALAFVHVRVPTGFAEDRWVRAAEVRPSVRAVVHHILIFIDVPGSPRGLPLQQRPCLAGYVPGDVPTLCPPGTAKRVPAGSDLVFEIHYTPIGRPVVDRSALGLIFADGPAEHEVVMRGIRADDFAIPPGHPAYPVAASFAFDRPIRLLAMLPHMHVRGKDFTYTAVYPDGRRTILLSVPAYDFAWQATYRLAEPLALPAGTRIECLAHFDNSPANPSNPDPTATVRWGDQTWDEMMMGYVDYYEEDDPPPPPAAVVARRPR